MKYIEMTINAVPFIHTCIYMLPVGRHEIKSISYASGIANTIDNLIEKI